MITTYNIRIYECYVYERYFFTCGHIYYFFFKICQGKINVQLLAI